jgi:hypothetical protein
MKLRHGFLALLVSLAIAGSCTNDFGKFDVTGDGDAMSTGGSGARGGSGAVSGSSGAGAGGTITGGTAGIGPTGGRSGTAGASGTSGDAGAAGSEGCETQEKDCGGDCVPLNDPTTGCASPDTCDPCELDHATAACASGECSVGRCDATWGNCNVDAADGCEQTLGNTVIHCGACDRACAAPGVASVECSGGLCVSSCTPGFANCVTPATGADDGCETNTTADASRCGGCGNSCTAQGLSVCAGGLCGCGSQGQCGNGSGVACTGGLCSCDATECRPGERCRQSGGNRLCACNGGAACTADQVCCQTPAGCTDVLTSATSCGACGRACTPGFACAAGRCTCDSDEDCDAGLVDTGGGGEGGAPPTGPSCVSGTCVCGTTVCSEGQRCLATGSCG